MHKFFGDWYRLAKIEPKSDDLPKRWEGVEAAASKVDSSSAIDVAKLFLGRNSVPEGAREQFASHFQKADAAFPMRDNDLELRVLAGSVIVHCVEIQRTSASTQLELAVLSGAAVGIRQTLLLSEIVSIVDQDVLNRALDLRTFSHVPRLPSIALKADQVAPPQTGADPAVLAGLLQKLRGDLETLHKSTDNANAQLDALLASALEQTDILWWLFAGRSRDTNVLFSDIPTAAAALIAGKELSDLTKLLPGPVAAPAVLDRVLPATAASPRLVSLKQAVSTVDESWKPRCLEGTAVQLDDLCPVHLALRMSIGSATWIKSFESQSGIKASRMVDPSVVAMQMYRERLLQRSSHV